MVDPLPRQIWWCLGGNLPGAGLQHTCHYLHHVIDLPHGPVTSSHWISLSPTQTISVASSRYVCTQSQYKLCTNFGFKQVSLLYNSPGSVSKATFLIGGNISNQVWKWHWTYCDGKFSFCYCQIIPSPRTSLGNVNTSLRWLYHSKLGCNNLQ